MNVLFTGLYPFWQCHFVAECNFLEEHLALGDSVTLLACDAFMKACVANPWNTRSTCLACMGLRDGIVNCLRSRPRILPLVDSDCQRLAHLTPIPYFRKLSELYEFNARGFPAGRDIISNLASATGTHDPDPRKCQPIIRDLLRDYLSVGITARNLLNKESMDKVYLFNGRFAPARAWIRACEEAGVEYISHERLGSPDRVFLFPNGSPHDFRNYAKRIEEFWAKHGSDPLVRREAEDFFEERPAGKLTGWISFVKDQKEGAVASFLKEGHRHIACFASTETEFAGLTEYFMDVPFRSQSQSFLSIADKLYERCPSMRIILRIHPNSQHQTIAWWESSDFRRRPNLVVVPPTHPLSSYELMMKCEKTLVFMSTMGAEATYWGKPSIVLSSALYRGSGVCYEPNNLEEAVKLLSMENLPPMPREKALAYGAFIRLAARKLPYSEAVNHCKLSFKGRRPSCHPSIVEFLQRSCSMRRWAPRFIHIMWEYCEYQRLRFMLRGEYGGLAKVQTRFNN